MLPLALTAPSTSHGQAEPGAGRGVCSPLWMALSMNVVVNARFCLPYVTSVCVGTVVCILVHLCMCAHFIFVCACDACVYVCGHVRVYLQRMLRIRRSRCGLFCSDAVWFPRWHGLAFPPITTYQLPPERCFQPPSNQWLKLPRTAGKMDSSPPARWFPQADKLTLGVLT